MNGAKWHLSVTLTRATCSPKFWLLSASGLVTVVVYQHFEILCFSLRSCIRKFYCFEKKGCVSGNIMFSKRLHGCVLEKTAVFQKRNWAVFCPYGPPYISHITTWITVIENNLSWTKGHPIQNNGHKPKQCTQRRLQRDHGCLFMLICFTCITRISLSYREKRNWI